MVARNYWAALELPPRITEAVLDAKIAELTALDEQWLRENPRTPWFYESGIWYEMEPPGQEKWLPIPVMFAQRQLGKGSDCEDMACYRAAELRVRGDQYRKIPSGHIVRTGPENAVAFWVNHLTEPGLKPGQYHVRVRRADGRIEDPAGMVGMYGTVHVQTWGSTHGIVAP